MGMEHYLRPSTLDAALAALSMRPPHSPYTPLAGGTDYYPAQVTSPAAEAILDITALPDLRQVEPHPDHWWIPCLTTWTDLIETPLPPAFDALKLAATQIGGRQIQNAGTLAGNVCNASPAADGIPCLLALQAMVVLASVTGTRTLPLHDFLLGPRNTARRPDELLLGFRIPRAHETARSTFLKVGARRYLVISIASVAAVIARDPDHRITYARIAVGSCAATAQRLPVLEQALIGTTGDLPAILDLTPLAPIDDIRATAAYRRHATGVLIRRAIAA
jgi:CO/xanthine dehydrogenase FAD-binding subunit